jgi:peptidoglycan/xylan/chitin deacetylase (PgdA/CDA1 family)
MPRELILTFHGLGEPPPTATQAERDVWVPVGWLSSIVDALPEQGVGIAFDDGNSSDVEHALAALLQRGRRARFFVLAGRLGQDGYLDADDLRRLSGAGMTIGSHGLDHRDWRSLGEEELRGELVQSRRTLGEVLDEDVEEAACPFGSYDRRVLRALRAAGYRRVYNSDGGCGRLGAWLMPRTTVHRGRPLGHWQELAAGGSSRRPGASMVGKRLLKRLR